MWGFLIHQIRSGSTHLSICLQYESKNVTRGPPSCSPLQSSLGNSLPLPATLTGWGIHQVTSFLGLEPQFPALISDQVEQAALGSPQWFDAIVSYGMPVPWHPGPTGNASFRERGGGSVIYRGCLTGLPEEDGIPCLLLMKRLSWNLAINPFLWNFSATSLFVDVETSSRASWKQRIVRGWWGHHQSSKLFQGPLLIGQTGGGSPSHSAPSSLNLIWPCSLTPSIQHVCTAWGLSTIGNSTFQFLKSLFGNNFKHRETRQE